MILRFMAMAILTILSLSACKTSAEQSNQKTDNHSETIQPMTPEEKSVYIDKGKTIAQTTFKALSGKLKPAMEAGGPAGAVQFCNAMAHPIIDSLAKAHHATIKRTSNKLRNQSNKPNEAEALQLAAYNAAIKGGQDLNPKVELLDSNTVAFYAPIKVAKLCLKCHGEVGQSTSKDDFATIQSLYPDDQATGYKEGDFRGIWSIQFDR